MQHQSRTLEVEDYTTISGLEHIRSKPEFYGCSHSRYPHREAIMNPSGMIEQVKTDVPDSIIRMFIEIVNNSYDECQRLRDAGRRVYPIEVVLDRMSVRVTNRGSCMPIIGSNGEYIPETMMSKPKSSSNYKKKKPGSIGTYGFGAKVVGGNSRWVTIVNADASSGKIYIQRWEDRMRIFYPPEIMEYNGNMSYVEVCYEPCFELMGYSNMTDEHFQILNRHCFDISYNSGLEIHVYTPVSELFFRGITDEAYAQAYFGELSNMMVLKNKKGDLKVILADPVKQCDNSIMSFVNTMHTPSGGCHIESSINCISRALRDKFNSGLNESEQKITITKVKNEMHAIVIAYADDPELSGASKGKLVKPTFEFSVTPSAIKQLLTWSFMKRLDDRYREQKRKLLKKTDGKKSEHLPPDIEKRVSDAKWAGTDRSEEAVFIITEGTSASTYINKWRSFQTDGPWRYGIGQSNGNPINVSSSSVGVEDLMDNKFISMVKCALGLVEEKDYSDPREFKTLRYGKLYLATDADGDGSHIRALMINYFREYFPSLLEIGYILSFSTPIIRAYKGKDIVGLYNLTQAKEWLSRNKGYVIKFSKGLGGWKESDIKWDCSNPRMIYYTYSIEDGELMDIFFKKEFADTRKDIMICCSESRLSDCNSDEEPLANFLMRDLTDFMISVLERHIPHCISGLKDVQERIIWATFIMPKKNKKSDGSVKMSVLLGEVSTQTRYDHGEESVYKAAVVMARTFCGSNNIELMSPEGQYGVRFDGGADYPSCRYLSIKEGKLFSLIFNPADLRMVERKKDDDGTLIHPTITLPTVPVHIINGAKGVSCGWSCYIPPHCPVSVIDATIDTITGNPPRLLQPWFRKYIGHAGYDRHEKVYKLECNARFYYDERVKTLVIVELPPQVTPKRVKKKLVDMIDGNMIDDYTVDCDGDHIWIVVDNIDQEDIHQLGLFFTRTMSNLVVRDSDNLPIKYDNVDAMLSEFCTKRLVYYKMRYDNIIESIEERLREASLKYRFISLCQDGSIMVNKSVKRVEVYSQMDKFDIPRQVYGKVKYDDFDEESMKRIKSELDSIAAELEAMKAKTPEDLWIDDLVALRSSYIKIRNTETELFYTERLSKIKSYIEKYAEDPYVLDCIYREIEVLEELLDNIA